MIPVNVPAEMLREGILIIGADGDILFANPRAGEMLSCDPESLVGQDIMTLIDGDDRPRTKAIIEEVTGGTPSLCEIAFARPLQARVDVLLSMGVAGHRVGGPATICVALTDLSQEKRLSEEVRRLKGRDELTGLHNRHYLTQSLETEWRRARRYGRALSCLMIDIDDFEAFNDSNGRAAGDALLRQIAELVRDSVRDTDVVARYTGGDICVLMPETPLGGAMTTAERLRFAIAALRFVADGRSVPITVSIGVFTHAETSRTGPDTLLDYAEAALRKAKATGKNRVYGPPAAVVRPEL